MRELYCTKPGELALRETTAKPAPGAGEVRVRAVYGGICGSDVSVFKGKIAYAAYPVVPGHEVYGEVTATGAGAEELAGKRVVVYPNTYCGECEYCKKGMTNICENKTSYGVTRDGVFSEEFNIDKRFVVEVPETLSSERAVLIEPLSVAIHALKRAKVTSNDKVAIFGCGTEGLLSCAVANYLGAEITSMDINPDKFDTAKALGAKHTAEPKNLSGEMFDVVIEASGAPPAAVQAYQIVKPGGRVLHIGLINEATIPILKVVRGELDILGSIIYTRGDFYTAIKYLSAPNFVIDPVRSKIVPFSDACAAYNDAASGNYAKIVLDFSK